jgi:sucrose-6-phosphate hydrolase SacC (GH32 family)
LRWRKLGKIFDPRDFQLPNNCLEFAQAPQALVFDKFIRIYFSTRQRDPRNGKYLSHVAFADIGKDTREVIGISSETVVPLGKLGCFDEHGIFPLNVLRHDGRVFAYTCGWSRRLSVSVETSIGLAYSEDGGQTFSKAGDGPILTSSLKEPFLVGDAFVRVYHGTFHMWYIFGTAWKRFSENAPADRIYKIGHAVSQDGIAWEKEEGRRVVPDSLDSDESQALPTVLQRDGRYHMLFCFRRSFDFRTNRGRGYRIGYAYSDDLVNWTRADDSAGIDVSETGWDSDMLCYPHVFECDGRAYLLYNGNEFGRYGFGMAVLE